MIMGAAIVLLILTLCQPSWGQPNTGNHLWNLRENGDDRFHDNEPWLRPWRYNYDDGWGRWVGYYTYELQWGPVSTIGNPDGSFSISRGRDNQFHTWTYVYCETARTITLSGGGDCVPRAFLHYSFDDPIGFPATLNLQSGWNRIDIAGYNQNDSYTFSCGALADLVDIMNDDSLSVQAPIPNADGPYTGDEGSSIDFSAGGSWDPDGDPLEYRWDFDTNGTWDTGWSSNPTASYTWFDDWTGTATVEVSDGVFTVPAAASVTVQNVAPVAVIDSVGQPSRRFVLCHHKLTFRGSFSDPGCPDTHTFTWDFDDGTTAEGVPDEEHDPPDATGSTVIRHAYTEPGTYSVTLTITDDNGGVGTSDAWAIRVLRAREGTQEP
jgi:hypothetical protein